MLRPLGQRYNGKHLVLAGNIGMDSYLRNILCFNEQLSPRGLAAERLERLRRSRPDAVILIGMGGSALAGEIVLGARTELGLRATPVVWKDYGLPPLSNSYHRPLYIFVSFSGNTEETLSGLKQLLKHRGQKIENRIAVVATGGELLRFARAKKLPHIAFSAGDLTPRQATGKLFYAISELLFAARLIGRKPQEFTHLRPTQSKRQGQTLARRLKRKLIVIYTTTADQYLGYFWKIRFNETAKTPAFNNVLPEMTHNEFVGFSERRFPAAALMLVPKNVRGRMAKRFQVTKRLLEGRGVDAMNVPLTGRTKLEAIWKTIVLADWSAYALAKLSKADPGETDIIDGPEGLKAQMRK
jgi:glucose/mannose-6-phosphate isomerase